eukprot:scaffold106_cov123-Cylindrotheca_fusiformis.AAC.17
MTKRRLGCLVDKKPSDDGGKVEACADSRLPGALQSKSYGADSVQRFIFNSDTWTRHLSVILSRSNSNSGLESHRKKRDSIT